MHARTSPCSFFSLAAGFLIALACAHPEAVRAQSAPSVTTLAVTNQDNHIASGFLAPASVNPNGASTAVIFQYGTDLTYSNASAPVFLSAGNSFVEVSATIVLRTPNQLFHVRAVASNSFGTNLGGDVTFTTPLRAPLILSADLGPSFPRATTNVLISVYVDPLNAAGSVYVLYGTVGSSAGYGLLSAPVSISGAGPMFANIPLSGLQPNTTYFYGVVATNSAGTNRLDDLTFTTGPLPPTVTSVPPSDVTGETFTLRGLVNPNSSPTAVYFQYSRIGAQTFFSTTNFLAAGNTAVPVSAGVNGLLANLCYDWRLIAVNNGGTSQTVSQPVCTLGLPPIARTLPAGVTAQTATLSGQATPNGVATTAYFQYGSTSAMSNSTSASSVGSGHGVFSFNASINNLQPNTLYYYRAVAVNAFGTNYGSQAVFTTRQISPTPSINPPSNSVAVTLTQTRQAKAVGYAIDGILNVYITDGGAGYTTPPAVTVALTAGGNSNGTVVASVAGDGSVGSLTVLNSGSYPATAQVSVTIAPPPNIIQQTLTNSTAAIIVLSAGSLDANTVITRDVTIRGQGMDLTTITGGGRDSVFHVMPGKRVTFEDLTITGGSALNGGGIHNEKGQIIVTRCRISNNHATGLGAEGGGVYNRGPATCVINNSLVHNNTANRNGGGISNSGLNTTVIPGLGKGLGGASNALHVLYTIVSDPNGFGVKVANTAKGAVYSLPDIGLQFVMQMSPATLYQDFVNQVHKLDGKFNNPLAAATVSFTSSSVSSVKSGFNDVYGSEWFSFGGAILTVNKSQIFDNVTDTEAAGFGGGIHNDVGLILLTDSELRGNRVKSNLGAFGGALDSFIGAVRMVRCTVHDNEASSTTVVCGGGAIFVAGSLLQIEDSDVSRNNAGALYLSRGGGLQATAGSDSTLLRSSFNQNRSGGGGGIENSYLSKLQATDCTISSNSVSGVIGANGGGVANDQGGEMTLERCTIDHNIATGLADGGGFYNHCKSDDWSKEFEFGEEEELDGVGGGKMSLELPAQLVGETTATLINCTISGNEARGVDLRIPNPLDVVACLAYNQVQPGFCSISTLPPTLTLHLPARGGAVFNGAESEDPIAFDDPTSLLSAHATLTISSCTLYGNSATGQDLVNIPGLSARTSGGGVFNTDTAGIATTRFGGANIDIANSIVASNTLNLQPSDFYNSRSIAFSDPTTAITTDGPNLDSDGSIGRAKNHGSAVNLTQTNTYLGPLAYNGGLTRTHAILGSSIGVDAASTGPGTDQRGVSRPQASRPDIGAFEAAFPRPIADSYTCLQGQSLVVSATNGVLANDFGAAIVATAFQLPQHGSLTMAADGSFTYTPTNNYRGPDFFMYQANDGGFSAFGTVSITVLPILHLQSSSSAANSVNAARDKLSLTFDFPVAPPAAATGIIIRGSQSLTQPFSAVSSSNVLNITPAAGFHPGEVVTVELLKSLVGTNGAGTPSTRIFQYVTAVNSGSGNFPVSTNVGGGRTVGVALSDLDGNGSIDAFVAKDDADEIWLNDGRGNFTRIQTLRGNSTAVALSDLNGDGFPDAVVTKGGGLIGLPNPNVVNAVYPSDYNRVYFNDGTGHFTESVQHLVTGTFIDPDTAPDPSWFHLTPTTVFLTGPSGEIYYYNPGSVDLSQFYHYLNEGSSGVAIADLNGDGYPDIFLINRNSRTVFNHLVSTPGNTVWLNNGHGAFLRTAQKLSESGAHGVSLADVDGNGTIDAIVAADDGTEVWVNDGAGNFTFSAAYPVVFNTAMAVAVGDLNGDGAIDIVSSNLRRYGFITQGSLFSNQVWINDGQGHFSATQSFGTVQANGLALGDLNGDGKLDVFATGIFGNEVWLNTGSNFVSSIPKFSPDFLGQNVALGDLDGDGDLDAFVANWDNLRILGPSANVNQVWFNDVRPSVGNLNFTVAEEGFLDVPPPGVFGGLNDIDSSSLSLQITATRVYTAPTLGALIGLVYNLPDYNVNNFRGNNTYVRTVPVFAQNGSLDLRPDGSFTYAPNPLFTGTDSFQFIVSDGFLSTTGLVTISVTPINHPPKAIADYYDLPGGTLNVNAANGLLANDQDVDGNALTASLVQNAAHGSVAVNANGSFSYTPNPGFTGADSFFYRASDGQTSSVARVKLGNAAPIAVNDAGYAMPASGNLTVTAVTGVLANDSDPDGDTITARLASPPGHGSVTLNADGTFSYTRTNGYSGNDVFTYQASDGFALSAPARVKIGNSAPVAADDGPYVAFLNTPLVVPAAQGLLANDSDPEGDPLVARLVAGPFSGSVALNPDGSFTYRPAPGFSGNDIFDYVANDGLTDSFQVQLTIGVYGQLTVASVDPPLNAINVPTNATIQVTFNANVNPAFLTGKFSVHGSLSGIHAVAASATNNQVRLTVAKGFQPGETVEVTVAPGVRGTGFLELQTGFTWRFTAVAPRGSALFSNVLVDSGNATNSLVVAGDLNGDGRPDAFAILLDEFGFGAPRLYLNNGDRTFSSQPFEGLDSSAFYRLATLGDFDGDGSLDIFVIGSRPVVWLNDGAGHFTKSELPEAPYYVKSIAVGDFNRDGRLDVFASAADLSNPESSTSAFWIWSNDGAGNFTIGPVAHTDTGFATTAIGDLNGDGSLDVWLTGFDGDRLWLNDGTGHFSPDPQRPGNGFGISVALDDLNGDGALDAIVDYYGGARVWLNNGSGKFIGTSQLLLQTNLVSALAIGDLNGDGSLDAIAAVPTDSDGINGFSIALINDGKGEFTPMAYGFPSIDSRGVAIADFDGNGTLDAFFANGENVPAPNTVWFNRSRPIARDDLYASATTTVAAPGLLANDSRGDGASFNAILDTQPANGSVTLSPNGSFTFTPGAGFAGTSVFTYHVADGDLDSPVARVKIGNSAPGAVADSYAALNDAALLVPAINGVLGNDSDPEGDRLVAVLAAPPAHGSVRLNNDGSFFYTATSGYLGADTFTYRATDNYATSAVATVSIDVRARLSVVSTTPTPNALAASPTAPITLLFNHPINASSAPANVAISSSLNGSRPVTINVSGNAITLTPASPFRPGEQVTVVVSTGLRGVNGELMSAPFQIQFRVAAPLGHGQLTDSSQRLIATPITNVVDVALADVDGDGNLDAIVASGSTFVFTNSVLFIFPTSKATMIWHNNGNGTFSDSGQRLGTNVSTGILTLDANRDGAPDFLVTKTDGPTELWLNNGAGNFSAASQTFFVPGQGTSNNVAVAGDFNGDGVPDLAFLHMLVLNPNTSVIGIWTNNGAGIFTDTGQRLRNGTDANPAQLVAADVDGDGDVDLIEINALSPARLWLNDGFGNFSDSGKTFGRFGTQGFTAGAVADLNGDGKPDFAGLIGFGTGAAIWFNDGLGNFTDSGQILGTNSQPSLKIADMDGDGSLDLLVLQFDSSASTNRSRIWFNDGTGHFSDRNILIGAPNLQARAMAIGDVNSDGAPDVFLVNFLAPRMVMLNTAALAPISGIAQNTVKDTETVAPFSNMVLKGLPNSTVTVSIELDDSAKGGLSASSLAAAGFVGPNGGPYTKAAASLNTAEAALRQLIFAPSRNRKAVGQFEATTFTVVVSDGATSQTNSSTVVNAISVNDPPLAANDSGAGFTTTEAAAFTTGNVLLNDSDVDPGDATNLAIVSISAPLTVGTVSNLGNGTFRYDPNGKFTPLPLGAVTNDFFSYVAADGHGGYSTGIVTISIAGLNNSPVAGDDTLVIGEHDAPVGISPKLLLNDADPDLGETSLLTITAINTAGTQADLALDAGSLIYNPNGAFSNLAQGTSAVDHFSYTIQDPHGASASANVTVTVVGQNDPPVAVGDVFTFNANIAPTNLTALLLSNDSDPDPGESATLSILGIDVSKTKGVAALASGLLTYQAGPQLASLPQGSNFVDNFDYIIQDVHGASARATVTITNIGFNQAPLALPDSLFVQQGQPATNLTAFLLANDGDPNSGETESLRITGLALTGTAGSVQLTAGAVLYSPAAVPQLGPSQSAIDRFSYVVSDTHGATATGTVTITIVGQDLEPSALSDVITIGSLDNPTDVTPMLLANDVNPNAGYAAALSAISVSTNGSRGELSFARRSIIYNPKGRFNTVAPGQLAVDGFSYTVSDPFGKTAVANVGVIIVGRPSVTQAFVKTNHQVHLHILGFKQTVCTIRASTDLVTWTTIGTATEASPGAFDFDDPTLATNLRRFYKVEQSLVGLKPENIPATVNGRVQSDDHFDLQISGLATNYTAYSSSNLVQWAPLGSATKIGPALYHFTDTNSPAYSKRFYRAKSGN